ncbi:MAG: DUF6597 domain-containing transcriptional factor [Flavisolibacter sp.]
MSLRFRHIEPHFRLKNYIEKMWVFESSGRMPAEDMKLVVPNGNIKLTLSYRNGMVAAVDGKTFESKENDITLTGMIDVPVILDTDEDVATETIGIEFTPRGAYRFFRFNLHYTQNRILSLTDLLGNQGKVLIEKTGDAGCAEEKIGLLQQFLIQQLSFHEEDRVFEYCVEQITASKGKLTVKELEKKTGYSSRWLNMKFDEKLGISLKNLSSIIRFKEYYKTFIDPLKDSRSRKDYYELYYDQSHFIKDFKRFTGLPPSRFEKQLNEFGERYYS